MHKFVGFPVGRLRVTPLPDLFFGELLPQIDDLAELKVTLHVLWRLAHQKSPLCVSLSTLRADPILRRSLQAAPLADALKRAAQRGALLELRTRSQAGAVELWYFANDEAGRRDAAHVRAGKLRLKQSAYLPPQNEPVERPNIFTLYERHVGMLTPLIAEQLQEAAQSYPPEWIDEAFTIAAQHDKRSWRYVAAILQRWMREGKRDDAAPRARSAPPAALKPKRRDRLAR